MSNNDTFATLSPERMVTVSPHERGFEELALGDHFIFKSDQDHGLRGPSVVAAEVLQKTSGASAQSLDGREITFNPWTPVVQLLGI